MGYLDQVTADPRSVKRLDILEICDIREKMLREAMIADPYRLAKKTENDAAMLLLPKLLEEIDALSASERMHRLIEGVFAGNIFDLGAVKTLEMFSKGSVDFRAVRAKLSPRPWLIDDLDRALAKLNSSMPYRCACLFVDNAGFDIVLGMFPFARELIRRGTRVIIAVNEAPSLNDITLAEITPMVEQIAAMDRATAVALENRMLEIIPSGCETPLIDLSRVTDDLAVAVVSRGVDLVVLEGMGRGLESNFDAPLKCDTMKIAMIKDAGVAQSMGGKVYDLVLRFEERD
jgi:type II pantothenate kinase